MILTRFACLHKRETRSNLITLQCIGLYPHGEAKAKLALMLRWSDGKVESGRRPAISDLRIIPMLKCVCWWIVVSFGNIGHLQIRFDFCLLSLFSHLMIFKFLSGALKELTNYMIIFLYNLRGYLMCSGVLMIKSAQTDILYLAIWYQKKDNLKLNIWLFNAIS